MTRKFNLWYHHDMIGRCKTNKFSHLVLGIIATNTLWHIIHTDTVGGLLYKFWVFLYLYSPSLIVNKMKVESIELIACHLYDKSL